MNASTRVRAIVATGVLGLGVVLAGCSGASPSADAAVPTPETLRLGVPPGEADPEFLDQMGPMADLVEQATGIPVEVTKTSDYLAIVEAMRSGLLDVAMFSPMPTVIARDVGRVEPLAVALGAPYRTEIICSPDAGVDELADIQDKSMAFVDPGSTSGNYIPRLLLQQAGVDLEALDETFAGGHDVSALSVKQGSTDCGAVASMILAQLVESGTLAESDYELIAESDPLPISLVIIAREGLDAEVKQQIADAFIGNTDEAILGITGAKELVAPEDADWTIFEEAASELGVTLEDAE